MVRSGASASGAARRPARPSGRGGAPASAAAARLGCTRRAAAEPGRRTFRVAGSAHQRRQPSRRRGRLRPTARRSSDHAAHHRRRRQRLRPNSPDIPWRGRHWRGGNGAAVPLPVAFRGTDFPAQPSPASRATRATFPRLDSQDEGLMRSCARFPPSVGSSPPLSDCLAPMGDGLAGWKHAFPYRGGDAVVARLQRGWRVEVAGRAAVARTLVEAFEAVLQRNACRDEVQVVVAALVRDQAIH
jgi:hypothetical protein